MKKLLLFFVMSMLAACIVFGITATVSAQEKDSDEFTLEEIIVTANRVESLASKTPIAVTAVTGNEITEQGLSNPIKLEDVVPNLAITRGALGLNFTIRGVTSHDMTEKGDPSAAFMLDNVYLARPQFNEVSFYDIERVEVLRGPQGTLYGKNTTAGVVNVITKNPNDYFEGAVNATIGDYNTYLADGMINVPVGEAFAMRAAFAYQRRDSYIYQPNGDYSIDPFKNNLSFRLKGLYTINDQVSLLLQTDYSKLKGTHKGGSQASTYDLSDIYNPRYIGGLSSKEMRTDYAVNTLPVENNDRTYGFNAELDWDFGPAALTYLGSYRKTDNDDIMSGDSTDEFIPATPQSFTSDGWQHQEELRVATSGDGPFTGQTGVYYFKEESGIAFWMYDLFGPGTKLGFPQDPTINESWAYYGQGTYSLTPVLRLTGGVRYSHDKKSRVGATVIEPFPGFEMNLVNNAAKTFTKTTWRAGLDYDLNDQTLLYGTVATGYKAGGFNDGCLSSQPGCNQPRDDYLFYDPETITAYEAGIKTKISDKVVLNATAFFYDYKNLQLSALVPIDPDNPSGGVNQVTRNAAKAENKGIEIESVFMPATYTRINVNLTYLDATYKDYVASSGDGSVNIDYEGRSLDNASKYKATLALLQRFPLSNGASIEGNLTFRWSDSYAMTDFAVPAQYEQPSYHKTDLSFTYTSESGAWYLQVFGKNLEDTITLMGASSTGITPGDPRTYGARAGIKF